MTTKLKGLTKLASYKLEVVITDFDYKPQLVIFYPSESKWGPLLHLVSKKNGGECAGTTDLLTV